MTEKLFKNNFRCLTECTRYAFEQYEPYLLKQIIFASDELTPDIKNTRYFGNSTYCITVQNT